MIFSITHIAPPMTIPKVNRIKAGAVSYMDILLVDNVSSAHWGFLLDQYFICRSRNPVLNILDNLKKNFLIHFSTAKNLCRKKKVANESLPDFPHLGELTVATGVYTHDGLLEQMNLR